MFFNSAYFFGKSDNGTSFQLCDFEYGLRVMISERTSLSIRCTFLLLHTSVALAAARKKGEKK